MIRVDQLRKQFGTVTAVNGVSFAAENGAITGLLGPNGAGKTTTLRMLYAVMTPDSGSIRVDDVDAVADPQEAQARLGVLPDGFGLYPRLTAREHLEYFGELHGISGAPLQAADEGAARSPRHERDRRPPHGRLLARRAHQGRRWRARSSTTRRTCCSTSRPTAST